MKSLKIGLISLSVLVAVGVSAVMINSSSEAVPPRANLSPSDFSTGITYEQAVKQKKPMVVNFYVDWCAYCRRFAPVLDSVRKSYTGQFNFVLVNCDKPQYKKLVEEYGINGYPTLYIIDPAKDNRVLISQSLYSSPEKLKIELNRFLRVNNYKK